MESRPMGLAENFFVSLTGATYIGNGRVGAKVAGPGQAIVAHLAHSTDPMTLSAVSELPVQEVEQMLELLREHNLLRGQRHLPKKNVALFGSEPIVQFLAVNLHVLKYITLHIESNHRVGLRDLVGGPLGLRDVGNRFNRALHEQLRAIRPLHVDQLQTSDSPDLLIGVHGFPADVEVAAMREGTAHLSVHLFEDAITLGPLVIPGKSTCTRCLRLHLRDRNPEFTQVDSASIAAAGHGSLPLNLTHIAAGLLGLLTHNYFTGRIEPFINNTLTISADLEITTSQYQPHPRCGCTWSFQGVISQQAS